MTAGYTWGFQSRQGGTEEGQLGLLSTYIMSVRDCKGPL